MALMRGTPFSLSSLSFHLNPRFPPPSSRSISSTTARFSTPISISFDAKTGINNKNTSSSSSKVLLKGMEYSELEKWVQAHGYRPGQALMLWKLLYGSNIWAHCSEELAGLNKDFRKMLGDTAELKALSVKDILTASDGTRKGMGEPLHNIDNVIKAAAIMVDEQGLHFSPRKVTISTSGLVPQLRHFLRESNCALAVSLNATTDEVRNWIMPINRKYNLGLLLETLREELQFKHNYKVLFEYVMLSGVNDSTEDAKRLIELVREIPCKINLISFNPHSGSQFKPTPEDKMIEFRNVLAEAGCVVFLRLSRGDDQMAACGQLGKPGEIQPPILRTPAQFQTIVG
ncbi:Ribosomal RNA large subunit methyltransferase RlmN/Cfr [Cinnamomum micranthum f. kanehirae]|uniref:Ribosomal RNA large subunit methyltransferase RlmN/Cfr n=1 Tax=Cinnamomum micranthum f. kanehirae TaxID=337451 RepID=A0A443PT31_9MAGN|nr:Ribosomal RNA large subunit methyltransferase RlmN/Cfr [Cinnamomum micranthum f. kanehirae]